jgi:hypothetical protein
MTTQEILEYIKNEANPQRRLEKVLSVAVGELVEINAKLGKLIELQQSQGVTYESTDIGAITQPLLPIENTLQPAQPAQPAPAQPLRPEVKTAQRPPQGKPQRKGGRG